MPPLLPLLCFNNPPSSPCLRVTLLQTLNTSRKPYHSKILKTLNLYMERAENQTSKATNFAYQIKSKCIAAYKLIKKGVYSFNYYRKKWLGKLSQLSLKIRCKDSQPKSGNYIRKSHFIRSTKNCSRRIQKSSRTFLNLFANFTLDVLDKKMCLY